MPNKRDDLCKYYTQGRYIPKNPEKNKTKGPCLYRSRPEYMIMRWFDLNSSIVEWGSESTVIYYKKPTDGRFHRYFVDFWCVYRNKDGNCVKYLLEYKPHKFVKMPKKTERMSNKTYAYLCETWAVNQAKWKAADEYAKKNNMKFMVISEDSVGIQQNR